jgi:hypothetical protein
MISTYYQFSKLEKGATITLKEFEHIFTGGSIVTIKDDSPRGAKEISYWDIKVGDKVNNGTRFIEIVE